MQKLGPPVGSLKWAQQNAVKQGLSNILGLSGAVSIIINFNLDAYEDDPAALHKLLVSAFKDHAVILEKSIMKEFYSLIGEPFESALVFDFATQLNSAKQLFEAKLVKS
ncbi:MAG: hypothetical protein PXY39_01845 [archaeon]|jgi:hypothetical protein|nr:hypothetical protein [archaeon]